ncbi:enoyl-CoA hydratase/isomerase family protein [Dokdonella sp.]|uniref:enoyl-CoA hydratase/isomerase family protein n=1 Tax=Dokdonella sp. TaxID=2291710 RepID=UPI00352945E1
MPVHTTLENGIAVITFDHPPVNGFGLAVRSGLVEAIQASIEDATVKAMVITGGGKMFSGGADITEFNTPRAEQAPNLHDVIAAIEASSKPIVMAINGTALGGGLEVAMAGHYRVAARDALLGLPEVKIGILPGGGGTQRLPRAVGLEAAVNMIVSGEPVPAGQLADTRLLDKVVDADVVAAAVAFAKGVAGDGELPLIRDLTVDHANAEGFLDVARNTVAAMAGPYPAPMKCLEAIEASFQKPFDEGMAVERAGFISLVTSTESKALPPTAASVRRQGRRCRETCSRAKSKASASSAPAPWVAASP